MFEGEKEEVAVTAVLAMEGPKRMWEDATLLGRWFLALMIDGEWK